MAGSFYGKLAVLPGGVKPYAFVYDVAVTPFEPVMNAAADSMAERTETIRYDLDTSIADAAGKMIREEIRREPSILIPTTIIRAVRTASIEV